MFMVNKVSCVIQLGLLIYHCDVIEKHGRKYIQHTAMFSTTAGTFLLLSIVACANIYINATLQQAK